MHLPRSLHFSIFLDSSLFISTFLSIYLYSYILNFILSLCSTFLSLSLSLSSLSLYIYIYISVCVCVCVCVFLYLSLYLCLYISVSASLPLSLSTNIYSRSFMPFSRDRKMARYPVWQQPNLRDRVRSAAAGPEEGLHANAQAWPVAPQERIHC